MTYEVYRYIYFGALIACGVMAVISVILFFALKIPRVINDLTGRTARKAIEDIRKQNEDTGDKAYKPSAVNLARGKITEKISESGRLIPREDGYSPISETEKISTSRLREEAESSATTVLAQETTLLSGSETTVLSGGNETTVLSKPTGTTTDAAPFSVDYEITFVHTDEII